MENTELDVELEVVDQPSETEPEESEVETGAEDAEVAEPQDEDSKYAAARRKAEAETERIRTEYEERERALNEKFQQLFKGHKNPDTGEEIQSAEDYLNAIQAQQKQRMRTKLEDAGLDPKEFDEAIARNPAVIEANRLLEQTKRNEGQRILNEQLAKIGQLDPNIKSLEDITKKPRFREWDALVRRGVSLEDAYKAIYFDELTSGKAAAARQAAINSAKGKSHLEPTGGNAMPTGSVEVPADVMRTMREMFPDDSAEKIRERYIKTLG